MRVLSLLMLAPAFSAFSLPSASLQNRNRPYAAEPAHLSKHSMSSPFRSSPFRSSPFVVRGGATVRSSKASSTALSSAASAPLLVYKSLVATSPFLTKIITSQLIFFLAYTIGHMIEPHDKQTTPVPFSFKTNTLFATLALPGLYFPITAHYWYEIVCKLFPSTLLPSVVFKSLLGQIFYGPLYTCVFFISQLIPSSPSPTFLSSLYQSATQTLVPKLKADFFDVWKYGVVFWIAVDIVSLKYIPLEFITLFVNGCSFVWTIYLSIMARKAEH